MTGYDSTEEHYDEQSKLDKRVKALWFPNEEGFRYFGADLRPHEVDVEWATLYLQHSQSHQAKQNE
jgi:hypothetical protein